MAIVSGPIKLVTDRPSAVTQVLVGAAALRLHGAGIVVDHPDGIPVVGGVVEFEALPGPAVLTMVSVGGAPMESVEIVVPDTETATLSECLDQIYVYDPPVVGRAQEFARQAGDAADRAEAGADRVGSAEQVGVWAGEAVASARDAHNDAERAEGAAAAADAAAGETSSLIRDEMDAKVEEAEGHAQSAGQSATLAGTHAVATSDDRRQTGLDRLATGEDVDETEELTAASIAAASLVEGVVAEALGQYRGTGFPEGVVTAPVGSIYTDQAATNGAIRWIKATGTGNTGWLIESSADTTTTLTAWTADAVGGRNLIPGATQEPRTYELPASSYYRDIGEDAPLEVGQTYTFSLIVDKVSDDTHPIQVHLGTGNGRRFSRDILDARNNDIPFGQRFSITFTPTEQEMEGEDRTHFAWRIRNQQQETTVSHRELKLERGPVATPWTPAPEDAVQSLLEGETPTSPFPRPDPALMIRTDNSVGNRIFVGDTMIYGDTGWRDVSDSGWQNGWTGKLHIRRDNNTVEYKFSELAHNGASSPTMYSRLLHGFHTSIGTLTAPLAVNPGGSAMGGNLITSSGSLNSIWRADYQNELINGRAAASVMFFTDQSWPTSLPGVPVN